MAKKKSQEMRLVVTFWLHQGFGDLRQPSFDYTGLPESWWPKESEDQASRLSWSPLPPLPLTIEERALFASRAESVVIQRGRKKITFKRVSDNAYDKLSEPDSPGSASPCRELVYVAV